MKAGSIIKDLETGFGIGGQVQFRIIQRKNQVVIGSTINVTQYELEITNANLSSEIWQQVSTLLIMYPFPLSNVLIGIIRIFISSAIP